MQNGKEQLEMIMAATREPVEQAIHQGSAYASAGGAVTGLVGFLTSSYGIGLLGVIVAFIGVVLNVAVNAYFKQKHYRMEKERHDKMMRRMRTQPGDLQ